VKKTALICGISGQDGALLAQVLLSKGYRVVGTSRDAQANSFFSLIKLNILDNIELCSMSLIDFRSVFHVITRCKPQEIYNFAGQSSVALSFDEPAETLQSHTIGTLNLLEVIRIIGQDIRLYNASSGECFGDTGELVAANEYSPFHPRSPYAVAKAAAFWEVVNYRDAYNLFVCSGILFNHESPLRPSRFVTRKVISAACRIAKGSNEKLVLGNLAIKRDWGWAPEYVYAMWLIMQQDSPSDYVIATGESHSLEDFVAESFRYFSLDWREHVVSDKALFRPSEILQSCGDAEKALKDLGWSAKSRMKDVVHQMINAELDSMAIKTT
jgi:GDPmannose 4,6-dehydratase